MLSSVVVVIAILIIISWMELNTKLRRLGILLNKTAPVTEVKFYLKIITYLIFKIRAIISDYENADAYWL